MSRNNYNSNRNRMFISKQFKRKSQISMRNPNFGSLETKLLLRYWGHPLIQKAIISTQKRSPIMFQLAEILRTHGFNRSPMEINVRIKNLKCFYNKIKKDLELGYTESSNWEHFLTMDEIINRPPLYHNDVNKHDLNVAKILRDISTDDLIDSKLIDRTFNVKQENGDISVNAPPTEPPPVNNNQIKNSVKIIDIQKESASSVAKRIPNILQHTTNKTKYFSLPTRSIKPTTTLSGISIPPVTSIQSSSNFISNLESLLSNNIISLQATNQATINNNNNNNNAQPRLVNSANSPMKVLLVQKPPTEKTPESQTTTSTPSKTIENESPELSDYRSLLNRLVELQSQTLMASEEKYQLENQRYSFIRKIGTEFLSFLEKNV